MLIRIDEIKEKGLVLDAEEGVEKFPDLQDMAAEEKLAFPIPIKTHLRVMLVSAMVEVEGRVETQVRLECSRCLGEFDLPVFADFSLTYARELPQISHEDGEEEIEVSAEEMGLELFEGEELDLREAVQDQVILALPLRPLCSEKCKGLCSRCGADLNQGDCGCAPSEFNIKFAALKDFKVRKDKK